FSPAKQQTGRYTMASRHERDRHPRLIAQRHQLRLLPHRIPPATLHPRDHLDSFHRRHSFALGLCLGLAHATKCPVENGATTSTSRGLFLACSTALLSGGYSGSGDYVSSRETGRAYPQVVLV